MVRAAVWGLVVCMAAGAQGGRGGIANATPAQTAAVAEMTAQLAPQTQAVAAARTALAAAALSQAPSDEELQSKVDAIQAAELALAGARADAFARLQASPNRLSREQVAALAGMAAGGRGGGAPGSIPNMTSQQVSALTQMTGEVASAAQGLNTARFDLATAALAEPRNEAAIRSCVDAVGAAELTLAKARAAAFTKLQANSNRLRADQVTALIANGGSLTSGPFSEPLPLDFNDHAGYVSLFDGVSLKDWDGNPKFWRVEGGAIVGESTPQNPSGNSYIVYRGIEAKDFTLKFEIKVEGDGGSGIQYRSKTGIPWLSPIAPNVTANVGPVNLNWMMTGPQADFWPSRVYTGQFYSENTPMRIMAWRGQVVEGAGMGPRRLMGTIGDRQALGNLVKMNDWNQYVVIARGPVFIHVVNGQLMAVMVDDDPTSSNNQSGLIGIEIEAVTRVSVRNIWLKKLN